MAESQTQLSPLVKLSIVFGTIAVLAGSYFAFTVLGETRFNITLTTNPDLEAGVVAHFTFDNGTIDLSSSTAEIISRAGGFRGDWRSHASTTVPGRLGQGIEFDGTDDFINVGDIGNIQSVAFWMKSSDLTQHIIDLNSSSGGGFGGESNGTAVNVTNAGNPPTYPVGDAGRMVVRTASSTLYAVANGSGSCEVWKSTDNGASWAEQDSANNPGCDSGDGVSVAVDSLNILHMAYLNNPNVDYVTFNTSDDTFGTSETLFGFSSAAGGNVSIAVDSNDKSHIVASGSGGTDGFVTYENKISGTRVDLEQVSSGTWTHLTVILNEESIPEIAYINNVDGDLTVARGNKNDASSFELNDVDTTVNNTADQRGSSIAVDASGNTWVAYVDSDDAVTLARHADDAAWSSGWTFVTNSNAGYEPSIATDGNQIYVFYEDASTNDIVYDRYDPTDGTWLGETVLESGTYQDAKARWAYRTNLLPNKEIDYLFSDGIDIYHNALTTADDTATTTGITSTAASSTAASFQRKTWYDGTRWWMSFYDNAANRIAFYHSTDGENWTDNSSADINDGDITEKFSVEADSSDAFVLYDTGINFNIFIRNASSSTSYPGVSFSWGVADIVFDGCSAPCSTPQYREVALTRDSNQNLFAATAIDDKKALVSKRSTNPNDGGAWEAEETILPSNYDVLESSYSIVPLAERDMYVVYASSTSATTANDVEGQKYTSGSGWSATTTLATGVPSGKEHNMSVVSDTSADEVYLAYIDSGENVVFRTYTDVDTTWSSPVTIATADATTTYNHVTLSKDTANSNDLYAFFEGNGRVYMKRASSPYAQSDWDSAGTTTLLSWGHIDSLTSSYEDGGGKILLEATQGTSSPFTILSYMLDTASYSGQTLTGAFIRRSSGELVAEGFTAPTAYVNSKVSSTTGTGWEHVVITSTASIDATTTQIARVDTNYYDGVLDDVRIYNRELSAGEVERLYELGATTRINTTLPGPPSLRNDLMLHWTFDGRDMDVGSMTAEVRDRSGQGNHGDGVFPALVPAQASEEKTEFITTTGGSQWEVPSDWTDNNTIHTIGGGGGGDGGTDSNGGGGAGGGGGAYASTTVSGLSPGANVEVTVGAGGSSPVPDGSDTFFNGTICGSSSVCAGGGVAGANGGTGGTVSVGDGYSGGNGGSGGAASGNGKGGGGGGGAGGAAGPNGAGVNGSAGSDGANSGSGGNGAAGGDGDNSSADGGTGGTAGTGGSPGTAGGAGGNGTNWTQTSDSATAGSGGGSGGGGGGDNNANGGNGGTSGAYGSGGGGGGGSGGSSGLGGTGAAGNQGIIVIEYTTASTPEQFDIGTTTPGRIGQALEFDGVNDYVFGGDISAAGTVRTVAFWMKAATTTANQPLAQLSISGGDRIETNGSSNVTATGFPAATVYVDAGSVSANIPDTDWHHVVVTDTTGVSGTDFNVGSTTQGLFGGTIDDVRIYDRALSAAEIKRLYELGATTRINVTVNTNPDLEKDLRGFWSFDGPDVDVGTNLIFDRSPHGGTNNATTTGMNTSTTTKPGKLGQGFEFDGVDDYVSMVDEGLANGTTVYTIAAWVKPYQVSSGGAIVSTYGPDFEVNQEFNLLLRGGDRPQWDTIDSTNNLSETWVTTNDSLVVANEWQHVVVQWQASPETWRAYYNGEEEAVENLFNPNDNPASIPDTGFPTRIGMRGDDNLPFDGVIDDVRIYSRLLSAGEIKRLYELGR